MEHEVLIKIYEELKTRSIEPNSLFASIDLDDNDSLTFDEI